MMLTMTPIDLIRWISFMVSIFALSVWEKPERSMSSSKLWIKGSIRRDEASLKRTKSTIMTVRMYWSFTRRN